MSEEKREARPDDGDGDPNNGRSPAKEAEKEPVADRSRKDNFRIIGPAVFRGQKLWTIRVKPGTYRNRSDRSHLSFGVLRAG